MADSFTSRVLVDYLCGLVNSRMLNPASQNTYELSDICALMGQEQSLVIVPAMKKAQQDYFVYNVDIQIIQGVNSYTFPPRAVGNAVRDIVLVDSAGNEVALNNLMREYIKVKFPFTFVPCIWSFGMYTTANEVNLYNTLIQSYTAYKLRFITERRPNELTLSTNCGQITAITGNVVTLSYVDPTWTTSSLFDIINQYPPFQTLGDDQTITNITGQQLTFTSLPASIVIGAWVCPQMLSCIPQIPYEFFPLLTELTVGDLAEGLDMSQLLAAANAKIQNWGQNAAAIIRPRNTGSVKLIVNRDNIGPGYGFGGGAGWR